MLLHMDCAGAADDGNSTDSSGYIHREQAARWAFNGLKGPWSRPPGSHPAAPAGAAALTKQSCTTVAITGHTAWLPTLPFIACEAVACVHLSKSVCCQLSYGIMEHEVTPNWLL